MAKDDAPSVESILQGVTGRQFKLKKHADGSFDLETDGTQADALSAADFLERLGPLSAEPYFKKPSPSLTKPGAPAITVGKAVADYLTAIKSTTIPKTHTLKASAVNGFATHYGTSKPLVDVHRTDVAGWLGALRAGGLATPTLTNKASYLKGFFKAMQGAGYYPHDDNPAQGQVVYGTREKRQRRALGFVAYPLAHIQKLFAPKALETLSAEARWGVMVGLYTGARVSEVGQLALADFMEVQGLPCIRITDDGKGQSLKNDASARIIPIHPDLVSLGINERVNALRAKGETRFFPNLKIGAVNGAGQWLSKAFSRHIANLGVKPAGKGRYGFHSLRKTVVQTLQGAGVASELRAAYVGHELDDEHHTTYSAPPTMLQLLNAIQGMGWGLDLKAIKLLLSMH